MEPPAIINANSMRDEVAKVMHSLRPLTQDDVEHNLVLGQYTAAEIDGKEVKGYLQEKGTPAQRQFSISQRNAMKVSVRELAGNAFFL